MANKKINTLLSLLVLPTACNVVSCGKPGIDRKISINKNEDGNTQTKNVINNLKNDEEIKEMHAQIKKMKAFLKQGIDGSKDFTPSQSLADINVQNRIIEKVKQLCNNPEHINFIPQLKSEYFKAGSENYVDVTIVYTKKDFQISSVYHDLQIRNVKQDLEELVNKAVDDLKNPIDFSKSVLIEHDDLTFDIIENEFINVLNNQLEQEDERLSIKLVNKSQDLLNGKGVEVEIIGKDDNEEIKRIIQVTPVKLSTLNEYISTLETTISITRKDKLFAYHQEFNPPYEIKEVINIIGGKFIQLNNDQLQKRKFDIVEDLTKIIMFTKGTNDFPISIKLEYNKLITSINLTLHDIEDHPEFILNKVANHFEMHGLDLSNEPIFQDSKFYDEKVKRKIEEIMQKLKHRVDEKDDIKIEASSYYPSFDQYFVTFSHKNPWITEKRISPKFKFVKLKNIEKSPKQDLNDLIKNTVRATIDSPIKINANHFDALYNCTPHKFANLVENNRHLNSHLEANIWDKGLAFSTLSSDKQKMHVRFTPQRIVPSDSNFIKVEYEFKSEKSGKTATLSKIITFTK